MILTLVLRHHPSFLLLSGRTAGGLAMSSGGGSPPPDLPLAKVPKGHYLENLDQEGLPSSDEFEEALTVLTGPRPFSISPKDSFFKSLPLKSFRVGMHLGARTRAVLEGWGTSNAEGVQAAADVLQELQQSSSSLNSALNSLDNSLEEVRKATASAADTLPAVAEAQSRPESVGGQLQSPTSTVSKKVPYLTFAIWGTVVTVALGAGYAIGYNRAMATVVAVVSPLPADAVPVNQGVYFLGWVWRIWISREKP